MAKFKAWLIPGIVVIIALAGLIYFRGRLPEQGESREPAKVVEVEVNKKPKGFAKAPEPTPQQKVEADNAAAASAMVSGDLSECDKIIWSEETKTQCKDNLNYISVIKSENESDCDILTDEILKTQCYDKIRMTAAVDGKNPKMCDGISDAGLRQMCLDQVQMLLARHATTAQDCSVISSKELRTQCENNYYMYNSAKTLDAEGCNNITDPATADRCRKTVTKNQEVIAQSKKAAEEAAVARTLREILAMCDGLNDKKATACKDAVYPQLAFDEKNLNHCDRISNKEVAADCRTEQGEKINTYYFRQSLASNDKTLCNQILDDSLKQLCQSS